MGVMCERKVTWDHSSVFGLAGLAHRSVPGYLADPEEQCSDGGWQDLQGQRGRLPVRAVARRVSP
jgi:hypothetical protein